MNIQFEKNLITDFLNKNSNIEFKEQPIVEENLKLINDTIEKIILIDKKFDLYFHRLQRKGIIYLIDKMKENLSFIPTNILRNNISPINNYIYITNYIATNCKLFDIDNIERNIKLNNNNNLLNYNLEENNQKENDYNCKYYINNLIGKEYLQVLHILNYFIDIEFNVKNNIQID